LERCLRRIRAEQAASNHRALSPMNGVLNTLALWSRAHDGSDSNAPSGEALRFDAAAGEAPTADAPRVDVPRVDAPQVDAPQVDAPQVDAPRVDAPLVDAPLVDAPRVEAAEVKASLAGLETWCWQDDTGGLRYAGARSTTWDTAFALRALLEAHAAQPDHGQDGVVASIRRGYAALAALQVTAAPPGLDEGRQDPTGGWCFGEPSHGWPVSDCTAEAVSALLLCHRSPNLIPPASRIAPDRLVAAIRFLLARQNPDGGFATYERRRGGNRLERLNPSEMFGSCMTERSYVECTASAIGTFRHVADLAADRLPPSVCIDCTQAMARARDFLLAAQRPDGAWPGFWGINFVYATGFAVAALRDAGLPADHPSVRRAIRWLESVQQPDGGWGEHFSGCLSGSYVPNAGSLVISTSWAVLALLRAGDAMSLAARGGLDWLAARQQPDGDWPRDSVNGVFFGTAMLDYRLYNTYFPVWALNLAGAVAARPREV
jgi:lanosterol synthase